MSETQCLLSFFNHVLLETLSRLVLYLELFRPVKVRRCEFGLELEDSDVLVGLEMLEISTR
jgi:hypothetical protein